MGAAVVESSPEVITSFMQQVIVEYHAYGMAHRRAEPREAVAIPAIAQRVDSSLDTIGEPFHVVTRDVSSGGIGLFHPSPVPLGLLKITLSSPETHETMVLLARVEHCTPCGGFFLIGCRFARVLNDLES